MIDRPNQLPNLGRRIVLGAGLGTLLVTILPQAALAAPEDVAAARKTLFGDRPIQDGRVKLTLPPIAENGYSVSLNISVASPMTQDDYVKQIAIFSPRNPLPNIARFHLTPDTGRAEVSTRIRLGGTQAVQAIAEMSDGTLWSGSAETVVTLAACVVL